MPLISKAALLDLPAPLHLPWRVLPQVLQRRLPTLLALLAPQRPVPPLHLQLVVLHALAIEIH